MEAVTQTFEPADNRPVVIFSQDEAIFGRINKVVSCWAPFGIRPLVPHQIVRQYLYVYSAICPLTGDNFTLILPKTNAAAMQIFLDELSKKFISNRIILLADQASWHKSQEIKMPSNIRMLYIPPRSPELNPTEHLWEYLRENHFHNREFSSLDFLEDALVEAINKSLSEN